MTKKLISFDDQAEPGEGLPAAVKTELNATYPHKRLASATRPSLANGVTLTAQGAAPQVVDIVDGVLYGAVGTALHASTNDGATWTQVATLPYEPQRLTATSDGEVLAVCLSRVFKSSGWSTNRATATWTQKLIANGTCAYGRYGFDGDGTKFIAAEYSGTRSDSRYAYISTDAGDTWTQIWDSVARYPDSHQVSHLHGCCYDPWEDRFWMTEGHGAPKGVYWSADNGATWTRLTGGYADSLDAMPMAMVATDDGIVCGTDDHPNGIMSIRRADPANLKLGVSWQRFEPRTGMYGLCERAFRDPDTGLVYFSFEAANANNRPYIAAGTASSGGLVWESDTDRAGDRVWNAVVTRSGRLLATVRLDGVNTALRGWVGPAGAPPENAGNALGATALNGTAFASGLRASASATDSTAVGRMAAASGTNSTAVGTVAKATGGNSVAFGRGAESTGTDRCTALGTSAAVSGAGSVAVGFSAQSTGANAAAVGTSAVASGSGATAVGVSATAGAGSTTVVGYQAQATALNAVAIGQGAQANSTWSIALGAQVVTTEERQVAVGGKHFEIGQLPAAPAAPAAGKFRLFARDVGGKMQVGIRFPTGVVQAIATEP